MDWDLNLALFALRASPLIITTSKPRVCATYGLHSNLLHGDRWRQVYWKKKKKRERNKRKEKIEKSTLGREFGFVNPFLLLDVLCDPINVIRR